LDGIFEAGVFVLSLIGAIGDRPNAPAWLGSFCRRVASPWFAKRRRAAWQLISASAFSAVPVQPAWRRPPLPDHAFSTSPHLPIETFNGACAEPVLLPNASHAVRLAEAESRRGVDILLNSNFGLPLR